MTTPPVRDIEGDYRRALLAEHAALVQAGRTEDAGRVAAILRDHYGHTVEPIPENADPQEPILPETTSAVPLPETAAAPKPRARKPREG